LIEKAEAKEALLEKDRQEAAQHYEPNEKATEFIKIVGQGSSFINLFVAANGVGKTATGCNIVANICYGPQNKYFEYPFYRKFPYMKRGRIISDPTTLKEKIVPELKKWLPGSYSLTFPEAEYETAKEGKNYEAKFITKTGWEIDLMSNEQDAKEFESVDLGWIWFDEPPSQAIYKACLGRTRLGCIIFFTLTPLFHTAWVKDEIIDKAIDVGADWVEAEIEDACKSHGVRGHLEHKNILQMVNAMTEDEKQARAFGKFGHLIGRVHKKFSRKIHVIRPFPLDEKRYTVYMALDPHPRIDDHALWLAVDKNGQKYICAELLSSGTTRELFERIKAVEIAGHYRMRDRIIDPSAFTDDQHQEEKSVGSRLHDLGMFFIKGSKDLQAGIKRTNEAFDYQMISGEMVRKPEIFIFDTCFIAIKQIEEYVWQEWKGKGADEKQPRATPRDKQDHQPENLHRLLLHEPQFILYQLFQHIDEEEVLDPYPNPMRV
jgi:phage terminase large subunit-like protein